VVLILDNTLKVSRRTSRCLIKPIIVPQPILNTTEVASLFSHPLASFLTSTPPFPSEPESLEVQYHTYTDWDWNNLGKIRSHRFLTGREAGGIKPVFGLTACAISTLPLC
jgi:coenzyme A diphosphatase NUDT7